VPRIVELELEHEPLDYPSKVDRRSAFIEKLLDAGRKRAEGTAGVPRQGRARVSASC
jgi:hypothetical protein